MSRWTVLTTKLFSTFWELKSYFLIHTKLILVLCLRIDRLHQLNYSIGSDISIDANSDPDSDLYPTLSFTHVGKSKFFQFLFTAMSGYIVFLIFFVIVIGVITFQYFGQFKLYIWLKWIRIRIVRPWMLWPDPDPPKWCRSVQIPIPIHSTACH